MSRLKATLLITLICSHISVAAFFFFMGTKAAQEFNNTTPVKDVIICKGP